MKGFIVIILFTLLFSCYGDDDDPGSTTYCRTIGKVGNDANCEKEDTTFSEFNLQIFFFPLFRCSLPARVIDQATNTCYGEVTNKMILEVSESDTSMTAFSLKENRISISDGKKVGSFCQIEREDSPPNFSNSSQKFYQFDPVDRKIGKVIWNQNPNEESNKEARDRRPANLRTNLIPMPTSTLQGINWIISVSTCRYSTSAGFNNYFYQIIEVTQ
jgi:hypothetical protein